MGENWDLGFAHHCLNGDITIFKMAPAAIDRIDNFARSTDVDVDVIDHTLVEQGNYPVNAEMSIHHLCLWTVPPC